MRRRVGWSAGIPLLPLHRSAPEGRAAFLGLPAGLRRGPAPAIPRAQLPGAIAAGARSHSRKQRCEFKGTLFIPASQGKEDSRMLVNVI